MILFMLLACLLAKCKKYRISLIWKDISLYPMFAIECVYWIFQICAFSGNFMFIPYSSALQSAYILSTLFPVLYHKMYGRAVSGAALILAGTGLNKIVIDANGGVMPVWPTLSRLTGYFKPQALDGGVDSIHTLMSGSTALNFLGDYIDVGFSIMSPGDVLMHLMVTVILYGAIKSLNEGELGGKRHGAT